MTENKKLTEKNDNKEVKHIPANESAKEKKEETKTEQSENKKEIAEEKEQKKPIQKKEKIKKTEAVVNGKSVPISTLDSIYICTFIKKKTIPRAIEELEEVLAFKRAIPMKGEIPHRKGKIMSGRYPIESVKQFIKLLKNLQANANVNGMDAPVIIEAIANQAYRPFGRFGRVRRKRTHIKIKAVEKKLLKKRNKEKK